MISHVISAWFVTWSVYNIHVISSCAVMWSVHDQPRDPGVIDMWSVHESYVISAWSATWTLHYPPRDQCMHTHVIRVWSASWSVGHLKVYFHTKETSSQILYCLSYSFLELKGENEQIWLQTLFRTVSQLSCNIDPTQSIISTQTSIITRTPQFSRFPKPIETYTWMHASLPGQLSSENSHGAPWTPPPGVSDISHLTVTISFLVMRKQFIFGCWIYTLPLKTNYS